MKSTYRGWILYVSGVTKGHLTTLCLGLHGWASTTKVIQPIWILLKQETVSRSGISWTICKSAPLIRQITTPAPIFFTGGMPFLLPNQQRRSTEGILITRLSKSGSRISDHWLLKCHVIFGGIHWQCWYFQYSVTGRVQCQWLLDSQCSVPNAPRLIWANIRVFKLCHFFV